MNDFEEKNVDQEQNGKKKSNKLLWTLLFVLIAVLTVVAVTSQSENFSFSEFIGFIGSLDIKFVLWAFLAMFGFILFEGLAIRTIATSFGYKRSLVKNYNTSNRPTVMELLNKYSDKNNFTIDVISDRPNNQVLVTVKFETFSYKLKSYAISCKENKIFSLKSSPNFLRLS